MNTSWPAANKTLSRVLTGYREEAPDITASFSELAKVAIKPGALDPKTKELMAPRCDGCIGFHTEAAIRYGVTRDEIVETIGVAVYMGGGSSFVYGAPVLEAFDQLSNEA